MPIKILIADDDELMCNLIKNIIQQFEEFTVVATTTNSENILGLVEQYQPDIVFIDIKMPVVDGLTAAHQLKREYPSIDVVFVTGHTQFAAEAFNLDVVDYIVKPVSSDRIEKTLEKILRLRGIQTAKVNNGEEQKKKLTLKSGHGLIVIDISNILFIEKSGPKCIVHTRYGKYETSETLSALEQKLNNRQFFRCHKGFLINIYQVEKVSPYADRAYEVKFYNYGQYALMRREKFEEFSILINL